MDFTKYNTLAEYHDFLLRKGSGGTADTYTKEMSMLLRDQQIINCKELDLSKVIEKLEKIKYKNQYSKAKNALLYFAEFLDIQIPDDAYKKLNEMQSEKTKKYRKQKTVELKKVKSHISNSKDKKLKLSYELMLASGLRVSELSQIKKEHCQITENQIIFTFLGKGNRNETVSISKSDNRKLFSNLLEIINNTLEDKKVFYSSGYLQEKAKIKGFACHDLRRAYAKSEYAKSGDIEKVMQSMRHKNQKTTEIYLNSKVQI